MSDGNSGMKICPLGNTQEMFKPQIRSYPIKIYAETSLIPKLNRPMRENLRTFGQHCNCVILLSFMWANAISVIL